MQFKSDTSEQSRVASMSGILVPEHVPGSFVGRLCQLIETMGLKDSQENAIKDTIKNIVYDTFGHDGSVEYIDSDLYSVILSVLWQERNYVKRNDVLISGGDYCLIKTIPDPLPPVDETK